MLPPALVEMVEPTVSASAFLTAMVQFFSAWRKTSSPPFLSSKRSSLKFDGVPPSVVRLLMPDCVRFAGRSYGGICSAL